MGWIVVWIFCGIVSALIGNSRGRSGCAWFLLGILLGPFGFAIALLRKVESISSPNSYGVLTISNYSMTKSNGF
jgi:hypothetical protein